MYSDWRQDELSTMLSTVSLSAQQYEQGHAVQFRTLLQSGHEIYIKDKHPALLRMGVAGDAVIVAFFRQFCTLKSQTG